MRILLFIDQLSSGGAQRQIVGLAKLFKDRGYSVKVITYYDQPFYKDFLDNNGVKNEVIPNAANTKTRIYHVYKYLRNIRPDVVISYLNTPCIVSCICKILGLKYRLIVSERNTTQKLTITERIKFCLYRFADVIIPNSYTQAKFIEQYNSELKSKVKVITNFVDTDVFCPTTVEVTNTTTRIICVGRILRQKNVLRFIEAIKILKDKGYKFRVDWYGENFGLYADECVKKTRDLGLDGILLWHEPTNDIIEEYRKSDLFILPSIYEGFPNVLCEAMSCGLPAVCGDVCDNPNIIEDGINGFLFDPYSVNDMAEKIMRMLDKTTDERKKTGKRSREIAISKFSYEKFIDDYIEIIKN